MFKHTFVKFEVSNTNSSRIFDINVTIVNIYGYQ